MNSGDIVACVGMLVSLGALIAFMYFCNKG